MGFGYGFDSGFGMAFGIMRVMMPRIFVLVFGTTVTANKIVSEDDAPAGKRSAGAV